MTSPKIRASVIVMNLKSLASYIRKSLLRHSINALLMSVCVGPSVIMAGPKGGVITGGTGSISKVSNNTTINQSSQNMAIDWQSYNLDTVSISLMKW
jgi:uncharacterized membrane protein